MALSINGEVVGDELILEEVAHTRNHILSPEERKKLSYDDLLNRAKERLINKTLLFQEARKRDGASSQELDAHYEKAVQQHGTEDALYKALGSAATEQQVRDYLRLNLEVEALLDEVCADLDEPSDADLNMFFEDNQRHYWKEDAGKKKRIPTFEEAKETLRRDLLDELKAMKVKIYLQKLRQKAIIVDHDPPNEFGFSAL